VVSTLSGKALSLSNERWLKRALGAAQKRDRSRWRRCGLRAQHLNRLVKGPIWAVSDGQHKVAEICRSPQSQRRMSYQKKADVQGKNLFVL
jgi:hypothetical protein